jgi:hypothetical protein
MYPGQEAFDQSHSGIPSWGQGSLINIFNSVEWLPNVITDIYGYFSFDYPMFVKIMKS